MQTLLPRLGDVTPRQLAFLVILALLVTVTSGSMAQTPVFLPPLDGDTNSTASAINARGEVVGISFGSGLITAVVWDRSGTPRALPSLITPFATGGRAVAINARGEVAGTILEDSARGNVVVVWDRNGTPSFRSRPTPQESNCENISAAGINNRGEVSGNCQDGGGVPEIFTAIMWDRSGTPSFLLPLAGDTDSIARGINARGEVAGTSSGSTGSTAVVWDSRGNPTPLPPLAGDTDSSASAINDRGEVAGISRGPGGKTGVVWDRSGATRILPPFEAEDIVIFPVDEVNGINDRGEVVGAVIDTFELVQVPIVWDRSGTPILLPFPLVPPGPDTLEFFSVATAINARGAIAGIGAAVDFDLGNIRTAVVWR